MPTRQNRYFNDPNMAAAFSNLAGIFAPPSAQDFYAMSRTEGQDFQNQAIRDAWGAMTAPTVTPQVQDRFGIAATLFGQGFDPTQSNRAVDIASADRRYGTDVGARTTLATNAADNNRLIRLGLLDAQTNPAGTQGISDEDITALLGIDLPGFGAMQPVAPTDAQVLGANRLEMIDQIPGLREALATDGVDASSVVTPDGVRMAPTGLAAVTGQEPFINRGAEAAPTAITFERGGQRVGGFVRDGQFVDSAGVPLTPEEAGTAVRLGQPQGTNADVGVTNSNQTDFNRVQQTVVTSNALIDDLERLITSRAGAAGLPGTIQMLGQDIVQVARELGAAFANDPDAIITPDMLAQVAGVGSSYDPVFREIRAGMLQLAYLNAQRDNPRGEVSRFALERQIEALGQGAFANDQSVLAALGMSRRANDRALLGAEALVGRTPGQMPPAAAPAQPAAAARPRATNPNTGETVEWDGQAWVPVQ